MDLPTDVADLTNAQIAHIVANHPHSIQMLSSLYAQREEARHRRCVEAECREQEAAIVAAKRLEEKRRYSRPLKDQALEAAKRLEEDVTDAGKSYVSMAFSVDAAPARGKTAFLSFLLATMADAGILTAEMTRRLTESPALTLHAVLSLDEPDRETVVLDIDLNAIIEELLA